MNFQRPGWFLNLCFAETSGGHFSGRQTLERDVGSWTVPRLEGPRRLQNVNPIESSGENFWALCQYANLSTGETSPLAIQLLILFQFQVLANYANYIPEGILTHPLYQVYTRTRLFAVLRKLMAQNALERQWRRREGLYDFRKAHYFTILIILVSVSFLLRHKCRC